MDQEGSASVLLVDDDPEIHRLVRAALAGLVGLVTVSDADSAAEQLARQPDVVLLDLDLGGKPGDTVLDAVLERSPMSTVYVLSGTRDVDRAVDLMRRGADDFLSKPIAAVQLRRRVEAALVRRRLATRLARRHDDLPSEDPSLRILQLSPSTVMQDLCSTIRTVAPSEMAVLVLGETGTGKELIARAIHAASRRAAGPFVTINCGALPRELMEAELFGHTAGAFTGASGKRNGLILEAEGGTLFLDEVGELPLELQPKLLRFLQEGEIRAVGSDRTRRVDVRVVAATHQDLEGRAAAGDFREDLYFRLSVLPLPVPPLRERQSDVPGLAEYFLREAAAHAGRQLKGFERPALRALMTRPWPGNVRELQNVVRRAVVFAEGPLITTSDLGVDGAERPGSKVQWPAELLQAPFSEARAEMVSDFEHAYVSAALAAADGNVAEAARSAGLPRKSLWRIAQRVGLAADRASRKAGLLESGAAEADREPSEAEAETLALMEAEREGYRQRSRETLAELRATLAGRPNLDDWAGIRLKAHRLKGSGAAYGFASVSEVGALLEDAAAGLDADGCRDHLVALDSALAT
jgi:DNA-binding NtrC family response regulator/HPt (histidine-containing phosphotransfer) domain-containing protein